MKKPEDSLMDKAAAYVALSRATCFEKLYLVEPVVLADLQSKPDDDELATLDFLDRLGTATEAALFEDPSTFRPISVRSVAEGYTIGGKRGGGGIGGSAMGHPP